MSDNGEITMFLPGDSEEDARGYYPYESEELAREFCEGTGVENVYKVTAYLDFHSLELVPETT